MLPEFRLNVGNRREGWQCPPPTPGSRLAWCCPVPRGQPRAAPPQASKLGSWREVTWFGPSSLTAERMARETPESAPFAKTQARGVGKGEVPFKRPRGFVPRGILGVRQRLGQAWGAGVRGRHQCGATRLCPDGQPSHPHPGWLTPPLWSLQPLTPGQTSPHPVLAQCTAGAQERSQGPMPGTRAGLRPASCWPRLALGPCPKWGPGPQCRDLCTGEGVVRTPLSALAACWRPGKI